MTKGMNSYDAKQRRKMRRRNHIAKDLGTTKYRPRIKPPKSKDEILYKKKDWLDELDGE